MRCLALVGLGAGRVTAVTRTVLRSAGMRRACHSWSAASCPSSLGSRGLESQTDSAFMCNLHFPRRVFLNIKTSFQKLQIVVPMLGACRGSQLACRGYPNLLSLFASHYFCRSACIPSSNMCNLTCRCWSQMGLFCWHVLKGTPKGNDPPGSRYLILRHIHVARAQVERNSTPSARGLSGLPG